MGRRKGVKNHAVPHHIVYKQDSPVKKGQLYRVKYGLVWLVRRAENGQSVVVDELSTDDYFGYEALCDETYHTEARQMLVAGTVEVVSWQGLSSSIKSEINKKIIRRLTQSQWPERVLYVHGDVASRLYTYLTRLVQQKLGVCVGRSTEIYIPRHKDLALLLATTRETIHASLKKLRQQNLIKIKNSTTVVLPLFPG